MNRNGPVFVGEIGLEDCNLNFYDVLAAVSVLTRSSVQRKCDCSNRLNRAGDIRVTPVSHRPIFIFCITSYNISHIKKQVYEHSENRSRIYEIT